MDKPSIKKEISELASSIKTQVDNFGERVSKPELDELMEKIGRLHKRCSVLEHMNTPDQPNEEQSAKVEDPIITPAPAEEKPEPIITPAPPVEEAVKMSEPEVAPKVETNAKKMAIGINDKFQFIKELFAGDTEMYVTAIGKLNSISIPQEADLYFKSLQEINNWDEESETVQHLLTLMKKRFA